MNNLLQAGKDPMGAAIYDFHKNGKAGKLIVHSSMFDDDEIPVKKESSEEKTEDGEN